MRSFVLAIAVLAAALSFAQAAASSEKGTPAVPTVSYSRDWPLVTPKFYSITVDQTCAATYEGSSDWPTLSGTMEDDGVPVKFTMSAANCKRIFELAQKLDFFNGNYDYHPGKIANTGTKTLTYAGPDHHGKSSYNYSTNPLVQELAKIFTDTADTIQSGQKIASDYYHDRLGLVADLRYLDDNSRAHNVAEVQVIAPVLQQIVNDPAIINMARARAVRVLDRAGLPVPAPAQP